MRVLRDRLLGELGEALTAGVDLLYIVGGGLPNGEIPWTSGAVLTRDWLRGACQNKVRVLVVDACHFGRDVEALAEDGPAAVVAFPWEITRNAANAFWSTLMKCMTGSAAVSLERTLVTIRQALGASEWVIPRLATGLSDTSFFLGVAEEARRAYRDWVRDRRGSFAEGLFENSLKFSEAYRVPRLVAVDQAQSRQLAEVTRTLLPGNKPIVVRGEAGAGKSSLAGYLLWDWAVDGGHLQPDRIPVLVRLADLNRATILGHLNRAVLPPGVRSQLKGWRDSGQLLLLADGLDEAPNALDRLLKEADRRVPILVTTRPETLHRHILPRGSWTHYDLAPLSRAEARELIRGLPVPAELTTLFRSYPELAASPLLMVLVARAFAGRTAPRDRRELYDCLVMDILDPQVQAARGRRTNPPSSFDPSQSLPGLARVALALFEQEGPQFSEEAVKTWSSPVPDGSVSAWVDYLCDCGLIVDQGLDLARRRVLAFLHPCLHHYLAARAVAEMDEPDRIEWLKRWVWAAFARDDWEQLLRWVAVQVPDARAFVQEVRGEPADDDLFGTRRRLAGACALAAGLEPASLLPFDQNLEDFDAENLLGRICQTGPGPSERAVIETLGHGPWVVPWLLEMAEKHLGEVTGVPYLQALGKLGRGHPHLAGHLLSLFEQPTRTLLSLVECARALGELGDVSAVPDMLACLSTSNEADTQVALVEALGRLGDPEALEALADHLRVSETARVRAACAEALGHIGDESVKPGLLAGLRCSNEEASVREACALALGRLRVAEASGALAELLRDRQSPVLLHVASARAMTMLRADSQVLLAVLLQADDDPSVLMECVRGLELAGNSPSVNVLERLLASPETKLAVASAKALPRAGGEIAVPILLRCLGSPALGDGVRAECARGLGVLRRSIDAVGKLLLTQPNATLAQGCIDGLRLHGGNIASRYLKKARAVLQDVYVQAEIDHAREVLQTPADFRPIGLAVAQRSAEREGARSEAAVADAIRDDFGELRRVWAERGRPERIATLLGRLYEELTSREPPLTLFPDGRIGVPDGTNRSLT